MNCATCTRFLNDTVDNPKLVNQNYNLGIYPEHPRLLDYDRGNPYTTSQYPGGGGYAGYAYNVAYSRAMLQAALGQ